MSAEKFDRLSPKRPVQPDTGEYKEKPKVDVFSLKHEGQYDAVTARGQVMLPLALHHVIPWPMLCSFWNLMFDHGMTDAMRRYIGKFDGFADPNALGKEICWAKWNLVWGPQYRTSGVINFERGDPGNLETTDATSIDDMHAGAGPDSGRIVTVVAAGKEMHQLQSHFQNVKKIPPKDQQRFVNLIGALSHYFDAGIVPFRAEMWKIDTNNNSKKFVPPGGPQKLKAQHPTWLKAAQSKP